MFSVQNSLVLVVRCWFTPKLFLLRNRGCPSELSTLPWSLQCLKGRCCSWQKQLIICYLPSEKAKEQSQLNRAVFETCPGVTVSVEQQVLLSPAGSVCFSNQIQTALWSLLEGKDSCRLCSLGASWNPAGTHNSLGLSSQVERCSLRTQRLCQKFHCIVILCL